MRNRAPHTRSSTDRGLRGLRHQLIVSGGAAVQPSLSRAPRVECGGLPPLFAVRACQDVLLAVPGNANLPIGPFAACSVRAQYAVADGFQFLASVLQRVHRRCPLRCVTSLPNMAGVNHRAQFGEDATERPGETRIPCPYRHGGRVEHDATHRKQRSEVPSTRHKIGRSNSHGELRC